LRPFSNDLVRIQPFVDIINEGTIFNFHCHHFLSPAFATGKSKNTVLDVCLFTLLGISTEDHFITMPHR